MSNNLFTNPVQLDTIGATSAITHMILLAGIVWDSGDSGAVGDNLVIHSESAGTNIVFQATLAVAKDTIIFAPATPIPLIGLYLTTLDHGVVLVYLK